MRQKIGNTVALKMLTGSLLAMGGGSASAYDSITAQEAFDMVSSGAAVMLDVRTLQEVQWVGSPALVAGGSPIAYVIPFQFEDIDSAGNITVTKNSDFDALVDQTFPDHSQPIIAICRSGGRSSEAAEELERYPLLYTEVYEVDNYLQNGVGGFQGSNYGNATEGYRGYPQRLPNTMSPKKINVKTDSSRIVNSDDSVSWMDSGLPVTQRIDALKIPKPIPPLDN
jgi:rhodanese-related sulfurtransferase